MTDFLSKKVRCDVLLKKVRCDGFLTKTTINKLGQLYNVRVMSENVSVTYGPDFRKICACAFNEIQVHHSLDPSN